MLHKNILEVQFSLKVFFGGGVTNSIIDVSLVFIGDLTCFN